MKMNLIAALAGTTVLGAGLWFSQLPATTQTHGTSSLGIGARIERQTPLNQAHVNHQIARLHMPFIANQGQIDRTVAFYAPTFGGTTYVTNDGKIVYALPKFGSGKASEQTAKHTNMETQTSMAKPIKRLVLQEELVGGQVNAVLGEGKAITKVSYFKGNDLSKWRSNLPTYGLVSLGEIHAGIELKLKVYGNNVEKLFYVRAGAEPESIKVKLIGGGLNVNRFGELEVNTKLGTVKFTEPVAYQKKGGKKEYVKIAYAVNGDEYFFKVGEYDRAKELIIDPILAATFLGGSEFDVGGATGGITLDGTGGVYVAGITGSSDFPSIATQGTVADRTFGGTQEGFVARLNSNLTAIRAATFLGGSGFDEITTNALALDSTGNVYVGGRADTSDFPGIGVQGAAADKTFENGEAFVIQLDPNLSAILAGTFLGGNSGDSADAITLDSAGNVYVVGNTFSLDFPGISQGTSADSTFGGPQEGFVARLDPTLSAINAATFLGGSDPGFFEIARDIAFDEIGSSVYVAGQTTSSDFPGIGVQGAAADSTFSGHTEGFVARLDSNLSVFLASTFLGGSGPGGDDFGNDESTSSIALDNNGGIVYVAGNTPSSDFPGIGVQGTAADKTFENREAFVIQLDPNLSAILAGTFLGGSGRFDNAAAIALDRAGNVYVAGTTSSSDFPGISQGTSADSTFGGISEGFVARLDPNLSAILAGTFLGGSDLELTTDIALNSAGNVYVAGITGIFTGGLTGTSDFPGIGAQGTAADSTFSGRTEGFVAQLDSGLSVAMPSANLAVTKTAPSQVTLGSIANLTYTVTVTNAGPAAATGVRLTDRLPANVEFVSASTGCSHSAGTVTCDLGSLASDANTSAEIVVRPTAAGTITNTAEVMRGNEPDPEPANNSTPPVNTTVITVDCDGANATIVGTGAGEVIEGTAVADVIRGLSGNDTISGRGGDDRICGDLGMDRLEGNNNNDRLFGGPDDDNLIGGIGNDFCDGGGQALGDAADCETAVNIP